MSQPVAINAKQDYQFRLAKTGDLEALLEVEKACFSNDRLSRRSFKHWIKARHGILLLIENNQQQLLGYGLVWCHQGTRLARLYSLAVIPSAQGQGLAQQLMTRLESAAVERGHLFMRLEVAKHNTAAVHLYQRNGFRIFGEYDDYYDDHSDALRMQKTIQQINPERTQRRTPWYQQTTPFTCGPAALMMAMASLNDNIQPNQLLELDIWREATTIFMTSGHGGCHPLGLALAAHKLEFDTKVFINTEQPLFMEGVRSNHKKDILALVHQHFLNQAQQCGHIEVLFQDITHTELLQCLQQGYAVVMLISTYRLDGRKAPHWVTVTSMDERCLYVHDPDPDGINQTPIDCQYLPIAREDFEKMSSFGSHRLRTALAIRLRD